ncbi:MAG: hypothetical protein ACJATS_002538, partial [Psychroserpens sp.]
KAGKEKVVRDKKEAQDTKVEIETELKDKNMKAEQEEWETENPGKHLEVSDTFVAPTEPKAELDVSPTPKNSGEVVEEETEARPLPVKVRKAQKKQD